MTSDLDPRWPAQPEPVGLTARASLLLEGCALARGLSTTRVSSRMFLASDVPGTERIGFYGTTSLETSRPAQRMCRDRVMRRVALLEQGIPVPQAQLFGTEQVEEAVAYSRSLGGGALVKSRVRGAAKFIRRPAPGGNAIRRRVTALEEALGRRSSFLLEEWTGGTHYTCYVIGTEVASVVRREGGLWTEEVYRSGPSGFGEMPPEVLELAVRTVRALPPLPHAAVQLRCTTPDEGPGECTVVSVDLGYGLLGPRPTPGWSVHIVDRMIAHAARELDTEAPAERVAVSFAMTAVHDGPATARDVQQWLTDTATEGTVDQVGDQEVGGTLSGSPGEAVMLPGLAASGRMAGRSPQLVSLQPVGFG